MTSKVFRAMFAASLMTTAPLLAKPLPELDPFGATILCYHIVEYPADPRMEISREAFRQQMRYLEMTGYTVVPLRDIYEYTTGKRATLPKNAIAITIDDGWRSTYTEAFPELKKRHFPFTLFIYPKIIGMTPYALTWKQVKQMADAGADIESHSLSHPFLTKRRHATLDAKQYADWLKKELVESRRVLEKETGHRVRFLAYPYGDYDHYLTASVAKAGYDAALTCDYGRVSRGTDPYRYKRVVIDKSMDFATFRHYLGARPLPIQDVTPLPGSLLDPGQMMISARIPNYQTLEPKSVGIALLSMTGTLPYSYDSQSGLISLMVNEGLQGTLQRALVWATERKSGRRVEASWTFRLPDVFGDPAFCPPIDPIAVVQRSPQTGGAAAAAESAPRAHAVAAPRLQN
jgi:peptidoglycan/xylan/chitin deacetylase (PgdA/CDA1 family)